MLENDPETTQKLDNVKFRSKMSETISSQATYLYLLASGSTPAAVYNSIVTTASPTLIKAIKEIFLNLKGKRIPISEPVAAQYLERSASRVERLSDQLERNTDSRRLLLRDRDLVRVAVHSALSHLFPRNHAPKTRSVCLSCSQQESA